MDYTSFLAGFAGLLIIWVVVGLAIRRWGPGVARHTVRCPETRTSAHISVQYIESGFGAVRPQDIVTCSLFAGGPVTCDKACLSRL